MTKADILLTQILESANEEFDGYAESEQEVQDYVTDQCDILMEELDVDVNPEDIFNTVINYITIENPMEEFCLECGDPDCEGC